VSCISTLSYILAVWGLTHGPVGPVAALRETSVLFAMVIAAFMLKERLGWRRILAAFIAVGGIALLRLA
jgi:drug/metabolite transporter (DMT)-like permease